MLIKKFAYSVCSLSLLLAVGCGDDGTDPPDIDAPGVDAPIDGPPVGNLDCATYCTSITASCVDANDQYGPDFCTNVCDTWEVGTEADTTGNTLGCHTYHATAAADDPDTHCGHAGPTGDGVCGATVCDNFCDLAMSACVDANEQYADKAACMDECANFDAGQAYNAAQTGGDTLACRFYHLTAAATDPATHCAHIIEASAACN